MKLIRKKAQHRRDYVGQMKCEFCDHEQVDNYGYDDDNYYQNVIPNMRCKSCGKSTNSEGGEIDNITPDVPSGVVI